MQGALGASLRPCAHRVEVHEPSQARAVLQQREPERLLQLVVVLVLSKTGSVTLCPRADAHPGTRQQIICTRCTTLHRVCKRWASVAERGGGRVCLLPGVCRRRSACASSAIIAAARAAAAAVHLLTPGAKVGAIVAAAPSPAPPATLASSADDHASGSVEDGL